MLPKTITIVCAMFLAAQTEALGCAYLPGAVIDGGNLQPMISRTALTPEACCALCSAHPNCTYWTHDNNSAYACRHQCCWLKNSMGRGTYTRSNATSGCVTRAAEPHGHCTAHPASPPTPRRPVPPTPPTHNGWPVPGCPDCPWFRPATNRSTAFDVEVSSPLSLPPTLTTLARLTIGVVTDYKPSIALLV